MNRWLDNILGIGLAAILAVTGMVLLLPTLMTIIASFDARRFIGSFPPESLSLRWYYEFFQSSYYMTALYYSLLIAVLTALLSSTIGFLAAVGLHYAPRRLANPLSAIFLAPLIVPGVVLGFGTLFLFAKMGFTWTFGKILAAHVLITMPYTIRTALTGIDGIKQSMIEAAFSLGATDIQVIRRILLPIAASSIATGFLFAFAFSMDDVAVTIFLTGTDVYTLPIAMLSNMKSDFNLSIAAASTFMVLIVLVMLFVLEAAVGIDRIVGRGIYGRAGS